MSGWAGRLGAALLVGTCAAAWAATPAPAEATSSRCGPAPLDGRALYLRGSFNAWAAEAARRLVWACDRWQLVTRLPDAEHRFKLGDEAWSADADWGAAASAAAGTGPGQDTSPGPGQADTTRLVPRGTELLRRLGGVQRFTLTWPEPGLQRSPQLSIEPCPLSPPLGDTTLYLRGSMNNWTALDNQAFQYSCDAYYLNVDLQGRHDFKIADAAWQAASTIDDGGRSFVREFNGPHTLRLAWHQGQPRLTVGHKTFADPRVTAVSHPVALGLRFDSRDAAHKSPFGAVPAGSTVQFAVTAPPGVDRLTLVLEQRRLEGNQEVLGYTELARVPMQRAAEPAADAPPAPLLPGQAGQVRQVGPGGPGGPKLEARQRFEARHRFDTVAVHGYWFEARIGDQTFALQNNDKTVAWTRELGAGGPASVAPLPPTPGSVRRFRLSVYRPDFQVPAWAQEAVYYYVFPERFRNGDARNDPRPGQRKYHDHGVEHHARWLDTPYRPGSGDGSDAFFNNDFFGGDLAGLIDKLDHLQALGVTAIYSTPLFAAASNHKYDTADYHRIDPGFGSNADFERLTQEAARRGLRVVIDTSFNHTGSDSLYFDRFGNFADAAGPGQGQGQDQARKGRRSPGAFAFGRVNPDSPYASWYRFDAGATDPDKKYRGWVGVKDLPELDKDAPAWRDFAYRAPDSVTRRWLNAGAQGWRMDVAPWVPDDFWREWRQVVKATRPDAVTIAETWFDPSKHLLGDMFDSSMNYIFRNAVLDWAAGGPATALAAQLELLREQVPPPAFGALMNLLSSHDQPRALHVLGDHGPGTAPAAAALARQRYRLALMLQMSYPGAPAVYYGDEVGLTGGEDPYNRAPYPWPDQGGQPDTALEAEFKRLIALRRQQPVLARGALLAPLWVDDAVLVLARHWTPGAAISDPAPEAATRGAAPGAATSGRAPAAATSGRAPAAAWAITAFSNAAGARTVEVALPQGAPDGPWRDSLSGALLQASAGRLRLTLPALGGVVLLAD